MRKLIKYLAVGSLVFGSCNKKGCTDNLALNYNEEAKKNDGSCMYEVVEKNEQPTIYIFERNGSSSVSFSGQSIRLSMLSELSSVLKSANTPGVQLDIEQLLNMYSNQNTPFSTSELNESSKSLESKTAGNDFVIVQKIKSRLEEIADLSEETKLEEYEAKNGTAGVLKSGEKMYLVTPYGIELAQIIEKDLMGAVMLYEVTQVYLGEEKMSANNTTVDEGLNYTKLEHYWDEAFGYVFGTVDFPTEGTDRFWAKYINGRNELLGSNETLYQAFIKGRFAITQKDLNERDKQIEIIIQELDKVCAATAIHYFNSAKKNISNDAIRSHTMSEAYAFLNDLTYIKNGKVNKNQALDYNSIIGDNFYEVSVQDINTVIDNLSNLYGFEDIKNTL